VSPTIHYESGYIFYFVSFDVASGEPAHIHVGEGSHRPAHDAKIWLEPNVQVAQRGRFGNREVRRILHIVESRREQFLGDWHAYKDRI